MIRYCGWWATVVVTGLLVSLPGFAVGFAAGHFWRLRKNVRNAYELGLKDAGKAEEERVMKMLWGRIEPAPTMEELLHVVRTKQPGGSWEDAIRFVVERSGGRIASENLNVKT